jgi:hypothetical protein
MWRADDALLFLSVLIPQAHSIDNQEVSSDVQISDLTAARGNLAALLLRIEPFCSGMVLTEPSCQNGANLPRPCAANRRLDGFERRFLDVRFKNRTSNQGRFICATRSRF